MSQIVAIPREVFTARWHDRAGDGTLYEQYGVVLWKPEAAPEVAPPADPQPPEGEQRGPFFPPKKASPS